MSDPSSPTQPGAGRTGPDEPATTDLNGEVLSPDGIAAARTGDPSKEDGAGDDGSGEASTGIESPAKIIRIGAMVKQLLEELRDTELDEPSRDQLRDIYANSVAELKTAVSPELGAELDQLSFVFDDDELPSGVELRMAKAQLVGWLEGLFHGMQAALMAQQMNMRQQLEGMRQQLPESAGVQPRGGPGYL